MDRSFIVNETLDNQIVVRFFTDRNPVYFAGLTIAEHLGNDTEMLSARQWHWLLIQYLRGSHRRLLVDMTHQPHPHEWRVCYPLSRWSIDKAARLVELIGAVVDMPETLLVHLGPKVSMPDTESVINPMGRTWRAWPDGHDVP